MNPRTAVAVIRFIVALGLPRINEINATIPVATTAIVNILILYIIITNVRLTSNTIDMVDAILTKSLFLWYIPYTVAPALMLKTAIPTNILILDIIIQHDKGGFEECITHSLSRFDLIFIQSIMVIRLNLHFR